MISEVVYQYTHTKRGRGKNTPNSVISDKRGAICYTHKNVILN